MFLEANIAKKYKQICDNCDCLRNIKYHEFYQGNKDTIPYIKEGFIYYQLDIGDRASFWTADQSFMIFCEDCLEKLFNIIKAEVKFKVFK